MILTRRDKVLNNIISYSIFGLFLIHVIIVELFNNVEWFAATYNFSYDYLSELFNTSFVTSSIFILMCYRYRFCRYLFISSWALWSTSIFNIIGLAVLTPETYYSFSVFYANFMLLPTALLAINYFIIETRKPRRE